MYHYIIEHPNRGRYVTDGRNHRFSPIVTRDHPNVVRFSSLNQAARCYTELYRSTPEPGLLQIWCNYDDGVDDIGWERTPQESINEAMLEEVNKG